MKFEAVTRVSAHVNYSQREGNGTKFFSVDSKRQRRDNFDYEK